MFNSNLGHNSALLLDIRLGNLDDLDLKDVDNSPKGKCDDPIGLPVHGFPLMFNGSIWPNWAPLSDIML